MEATRDHMPRFLVALYRQARIAMKHRLDRNDDADHLTNLILERAYVCVVPAIWLMQHPLTFHCFSVMNFNGGLSRSDIILLEACRSLNALMTVSWTVMSRELGSRFERERWCERHTDLIPNLGCLGVQAKNPDHPTSIVDARSTILSRAVVFARDLGIGKTGAFGDVANWFSSHERPWHWAWDRATVTEVLSPPDGWFPEDLIDAFGSDFDRATMLVIPHSVDLEGWRLVPDPARPDCWWQR